MYGKWQGSSAGLLGPLCSILTVTACGGMSAPYAGDSATTGQRAYGGEAESVSVMSADSAGGAVAYGGDRAPAASPSMMEAEPSAPGEPGSYGTDEEVVVVDGRSADFDDDGDMIGPGVVVTQQQQYIPRLTAATVGDVDRRGNYLSYLSRHPNEEQVTQLDMSRRVRIRVQDARGRPINDAHLHLSGIGTVEGRTHADGIWDFYPAVGAPQGAGSAMLRVTAGQQNGHAVIDVPAAGDGQEVIVRLAGVTALTPTTLDLGFAIDVTGSMEDELRYINAEVGEIVQQIRRSAPETTVRVGATFYRDRSDPVVVQQIPFTTNVSGFAAAMGGIHASGGGDYPEDMNAGLEAALGRLAWSQGNAVRVLVLVADAPPKRYGNAQYTYHHALADASRRGIRIVPVAASGADRIVEYLFRAMGAATSTPYVYLTDDSGIGNPHMEADTDRVAVEHFSEVLTRMVISDLQGHGMHEPGPFGSEQ